VTNRTESFGDLLQSRLDRMGLSLEAGEVARFERYYRLLSKWNLRINLTSLELVNVPPATLDRLFVEPLLAAEFVSVVSGSWIDLGSGAGSPAIPLAMVRPKNRLTMVDSVAKKCAFLREACRATGLTDVRVTTARIEDLPALLPTGVADLLTVRAVRMDQALLATAAYLLSPVGRLLHFASGTVLPPSGFETVARKQLTTPDDILLVSRPVSQPPL
jgi:16S rRNA (guanine527-N7)-methyltransferase